MYCNKLIIVTGPTATGKTRFAAELAGLLDGEIISADSRQVFRNMNLGTGKDINDYSVGNRQIPFHLIDIINPGEKYSVYRFQHDFLKACKMIKMCGKIPVLCGGTGLYVESIVKQYRMHNVPENKELRTELAGKSLTELTEILSNLKKMHNVTDIDTKNRAIRAIEIAAFEKVTLQSAPDFPNLNCLILGINFDRSEIRQRITERLQQRIDAGMIEETKILIEQGVDPNVLISYGLEYKFTTWYLQNKITFQDYFSLLNTAIHQFAKRQMTWFRRMERNGIKIHWIDGNLPMIEKINFAMTLINKE